MTYIGLTKFVGLARRCAGKCPVTTRCKNQGAAVICDRSHAMPKTQRRLTVSKSQFSPLPQWPSAEDTGPTPRQLLDME